MKKIIVLSAIWLITLPLVAQNEMRLDESSGFNLQMQLLTKGNSTFVGVFPGYTMNGKLDFGLGIGFQNHDDYNVEVIGVYPWIEYMFMKQDEGSIPISVEVGYQFSRTNYDELQLNINSHALYGVVYHNISLNNDLRIMPGASFAIHNSMVDLNGFSDIETNFAYTFEVTVGFQNFWIRPYLRFFDRTNNIGFWVGYTF